MSRGPRAAWSVHHMVLGPAEVRGSLSMSSFETSLTFKYIYTGVSYLEINAWHLVSQQDSDALCISI